MLPPDGRWMAYTSDETGSYGIYVVPFPNAGDAEWPVSAGGGGTDPVWAHSGRELFYGNGQREVWAVRVETEPTFCAGPTSVLFSATEYRADPSHRQYDLILVQNFFEEIRRGCRVHAYGPERCAGRPLQDRASSARAG